MSIFEAISIQGIRSFDPNKPQILEFLKPVTVILGQNGSGKTTIIESLKYATTGDLPPGSKIGGSFVHDPKLSQESETKAKIVLEIKDVRGDSLNVSRSLKVVQKDKNKQMTLQTLDSSIKRKKANGETVSISSKCADINLEMINSLGVSKAVLESVIFCHQEESNWPLTEGKQVKQRFDDLFASTRYVKALDSIIKIKKEKIGEIKHYKTELKYLKVNRDEADKKLSEKKNLQTKVDGYNDKIQHIVEKLEPVESAIVNSQNQISQLNQIENDLNCKVSMKADNDLRIKELNKNIPESLDYSVDELKTMINDSARDLEKMKVEISGIETQIAELKLENSKTFKVNNSLLVEKGGLQSKIENHKSRKEKFDEQLKYICSNYNIEYNPSSATRSMMSFQNYITMEENEFNEKLEHNDQEIKRLQNSLDNKITEKTKLEHDIQMSSTSLKKKQLEFKDLNKRISDIGEDFNKLDSISINLTSLKQELSVFKSNFNAKDAKDRITKNNLNIISDEEQSNKVDKELSSVLRLDTVFNEINSLTKQINDKFKEAKRLGDRHMDKLNSIFDNNVPSSNIKKLLNDKISDWRIKSQRNQKDLVTFQSQLASLNVEDRQLRVKIEEKKSLVNKFEEDVFNICGNSEFNESLMNLKKKKLDLEEDIATAQGNVSLYRKFQTMLISKPECPLCHREFCNEDDSSNLLDEINEKINFVPNLDKKLKEVSVINVEFEKLLKLELQSKEIINLKTSVIDSLEKESQEKRNNICRLKSTIEKISIDQESCKHSEDLGNLLQVDVALMEKLTEEVKVLKKSLNDRQEQLTMTYDQFQEKVTQLKEQKNSLQNELLCKKRALNEERNSYEKSMNVENELMKNVNALEKRKLEIQSGQQEWSNLNTKKEDLKSEIDALEDQILINTSALEPIVNEVSSIKSDLNGLKMNRKVMENKSIKKINESKMQMRDLESTLSSFKIFENENVLEILKELDKKLSKNTFDINQNNQCISEMNDTIERHKSAISNNKIKNREMVDTISIRQYESDNIRLDEDIRVLISRLGGTNLVEIQSQLKQLENSRQAMKDEHSEATHFRSQSLNQINYIEQEIREKYQDAEQTYLSMLCKMKVIEIIVTDLEKYYKALDQAIMSHHKSKMTEINKILKELWRNTYSGKDIDFIEICSDEESSAAGAKKRTFNYRVVMVKSGIRLDMRGRCSAGQKVLACLLIRLALAEVFCLHCGVLSLDEPTTNLDHDNIKSLADALEKIIKTRSKQKNFQLILITHDEDFLSMLSQSDYVDEFYKIHCDTNGHSQINKTRIDHR